MGEDRGLLARQRAFHYLVAMNDRSPIVSEFETPEQAAAYEEWLVEKVAASLADGRPPVSHDEAMAQARSIVERHKEGKAKRGKSC
jgi:hypothetical protein